MAGAVAWMMVLMLTADVDSVLAWPFAVGRDSTDKYLISVMTSLISVMTGLD